MSTALPYGRQTIEADDLAAVERALRSTYLTTGPLVEEFEVALAGKCGARHAISCNSGTAALHLALAGAGFGAGDVAIVPSITFVATANVARLLGGEVAFCDVDPDSGRMRLADLERAMQTARMRGRPRAVLPVHMAGQCVEDMGAIRELAQREGLAVVEDACHALGAVQVVPGGAPRPVGACASSDACCFSFHPVKAITTAEGGAVLTNDDRLAETTRLVRSHGITRAPAALRFPDRARDDEGAANPWYYEQHLLGLNYRLPDLNCALGLSQLAKLDRFIAQRRALVRRYREKLGNGSACVRVADTADVDNSAWHLMVVHVDFEAARTTRAALMRRLQAAGIGTQVHYIPVHWQPDYVERYGACELPDAERYYGGCISLPLFPTMTLADVDRVVEVLCEGLR